MKLYLASPFFNEEQVLYEDLVANALLKNKEVVNVFRPKLIEAENEMGTNEWKQEIFNIDRNEIDKADMVVAIANYEEIDEQIILDPGTCWEIGYAYGTHKPVLLLTFGYNPEETVLNLMVDKGTYRHLNFKELEEVNQLSSISLLKLTGKHEDWKGI